MDQVRVERLLENISTPLFHRYSVLKDRLLNVEYEQVAAGFPEGNNHGKGHIIRVLEKFDQLVGEDPVSKGILNTQELFLALVTIVYHDIGLLRGRTEHAEKSGQMVSNEKNPYVINEHEKEIVEAGVTCHSSSKDIDVVCRHLPEEVIVGHEPIRPRTIAALVRLADELDEDFRRADDILAKRIALPPTSEFYWRFCQRISGIQPRLQDHEIHFSVRFEKEDVNNILVVGKQERAFIAGFVQKLQKINSERVIVNKYLPESVRYRRLVLSVRPLSKAEDVAVFRFEDSTSAMEGLEALPKFLIDPARALLIGAIEHLIQGDFQTAASEFQRIELLASDLPSRNAVACYYSLARFYIARAERSDRVDQPQLFERAAGSIRNWVQAGEAGGWNETNETPEIAVTRFASDPHLQPLLRRKETLVREILGRHETFLPSKIGQRIRGTRRSDDLRSNSCRVLLGFGIPATDTPEKAITFVTTLAEALSAKNEIFIYSGTNGGNLATLFCMELIKRSERNLKRILSFVPEEHQGQHRSLVFSPSEKRPQIHNLIGELIPAGRTVEVRRRQMVEACDLCILMAGGRAIYQYFDCCRDYGKPVIPLRFSGGATKTIAESDEDLAACIESIRKSAGESGLMLLHKLNAPSTTIGGKVRCTVRLIDLIANG